MELLIDVILYKNDEICLKYNRINAIEEKIDNNIFIKYKTDDINNEINIFDNNCIFIRESDEFEFKLDTIENEATYLLKETNTKLDIKIDNIDFKLKGENIHLIYQLETDDCQNKIEIIKGE